RVTPRHPRPPLSPYTTLFRSVLGRDEDEPVEGADGVRPPQGVRLLVVPQQRGQRFVEHRQVDLAQVDQRELRVPPLGCDLVHPPDRKSTRLNSSHVKISYAVF